MTKKESIEKAAARLETELAAIEPKDASLWAVVQACRATIMAKRAEGASWAQIAAAFRAAGFANATETNVRLAAQAREPLKKVSKARRRQQKQAVQPQAPAVVQPTSAASSGQGPALLRNRWK
jgi:peptidoglycan hydrolase CwlO-like protein